MIFLAPENRSIHISCMKKFVEEPAEQKLDEDLKLSVMNIKTMEYDGAIFNLRVPPDALTTMTLSLDSPFIEVMLANGGKEMLDAKYGKFSPKIEEGKKVTITVEGDGLGDAAEDTAMLCAMLKRNIYAAPVEACFNAIIGDAPVPKPLAIQYRKDGVMYLNPTKEQLSVVTAIYFQDPTDRAMVQVFLNEFKEALRRVSSAPAVSWGAGAKASIAADIVDFGIPDEDLEYVGLAISDRYLKDPKQYATTVNMVLGLRAYLHYHIKCSKSFLHSTMRDKVTEWKSRLNRAKPGSGKQAKRNI